MLLEVALLARRERVIDEDDVGGLRRGDVTNLIRLAAAHEEPRIRALAATGDRGDRLRARRSGELRELLQIFRIDVYAQPEAHENRTLTVCVGARTLWDSIRVDP